MYSFICNYLPSCEPLIVKVPTNVHHVLHFILFSSGNSFLKEENVRFTTESGQEEWKGGIYI